MNIGFDGKRATQNLTGLGNYSRYLIRLLTIFYPENKYLVYTLKNPSTGMAIKDVVYKYPGKQLFKSYWRSKSVVNDLIRDKIDLFHGLSNEIPFGLKSAGIASVVSIHDLIFIRYPQYYSFIDRAIYRLKFRYAAQQADKIIAISEQTKNDLIQFLGVSEESIEVIYQDCDPMFHQIVSPSLKAEIKERYTLPDKYILNVGTIEERKNLMLIVKALAEVADIHLVVVGRETSYSQKVRQFIKENKLHERVHFLKNVSYLDLPAIYQQAVLFIYPSRFEGFGIPVVEALHSGVPVIAAKGSCLEEAGGPDSIYVDPDDELEMAVQIKNVLDNDEKRIKMVSAGREYLNKFDSKRISGQLMQLYQNVINHAKR